MPQWHKVLYLEDSFSSGVDTNAQNGSNENKTAFWKPCIPSIFGSGMNMPSLFFTFNLVHRKEPVKPVKMYSFRKIPWQQARQSCSFPTVLILGKHRISHVKSLSENEVMGYLRPCCQLVSVNVPQASLEYKCNGTIESKTKASFHPWACYGAQL